MRSFVALLLRIKNEKLAVADGRVLSVLNCKKDGDIKVRIIRIKHNIFAGIVTNVSIAEKLTIKIR